MDSEAAALTWGRRWGAGRAQNSPWLRRLGPTVKLEGRWPWA